MQAAEGSLWRQFYREAVLELDPKLLQSKLQIATKAIESRLSELPAHSVAREVIDLTDAKRILGYLQDNKLASTLWTL